MLSLRRVPEFSRAQRRDPAPSRFKYRLTRFWLRPGVRRMVNFVLPAAALVAGGWTLAVEFELGTRAEAAWRWAREAVVERPQFIISRFDIPGVSSELAEQIAEAALVPLPASSLEVNVAAVRERVEALSAVKGARVRALPSGALEIRAIERSPVVLWRSAKGLQLLDEGGVRVAEVDSRRRRIDLPLIVGAGANEEVPEARSILIVASPVADRVRGLVRVGGRRWDLVLDRGQVLRLPETEPAAALGFALRLHESARLLDRNITVVDLRDPRRPTARLTEEAKAELEERRAAVRGEDA